MIRYLAKPSSPSPAASIFTALTSAMYSLAFGPVSKITVVPASGTKDQLASADGLIVPCSTDVADDHVAVGVRRLEDDLGSR